MPAPLPDWSIGPALRRTSMAAAGVGPRERYGDLWRRPFRGRYVWAGTDADDPAQRIRAAASVLPADGVLGGWAAAYLWGAVDLDGQGPLGRACLPVPLCLPPGRQCRPRPGVVCWRSALADDDRASCAGLPVTDPVRTAFDAARFAPGLVEAVVAVDALLRTGRVSPVRLAAYLAARPGWRGVPQLRAALALADGRTASAP